MLVLESQQDFVLWSPSKKSKLEVGTGSKPGKTDLEGQKYKSMARNLWLFLRLVVLDPSQLVLGISQETEYQRLKIWSGMS